jgi:hypothetical protein
MPPSKKQIGIYWGDKALHVVEVEKGNFQNLFSVPLNGHKEGEAKSNFSSVGTLGLSNFIVDTLRKHNIVSPVIHMALPTREIIFRSFVIPWMQTNEVKGVVEFEASKYVPFPIKELAYAYQSVVITENHVKRLRIIFAAIKKETLEKYLNTFTQVALSINVVEPSALSLVRLLSFKNLITTGQPFAIVEKNEDVGRIIIFDQGVPLFIREFVLNPSSKGVERFDPQQNFTRLANEIRISLDYFARQFSPIKASQVYLLSGSNTADLVKNLQSHIDIPLNPIDISNLLGGSTAASETGYLNAYGATLTEIAPTQIQLDFYTERPKSKSFSMHSTSGPSFDVKSVILVALGCCLAVGASYFVSRSKISGPQNELDQLVQQLGIAKDMEVSILKEKNTSLQKKLDGFKDIDPHSQVTKILNILPELLPQQNSHGIWLKDMNIAYTDKTVKDKLLSKPTISLSGYAFLEDKKAQFGLVNVFLKNLKEHKEFAPLFETIDLATVRMENINGFDVTYFEIKCQ